LLSSTIVSVIELDFIHSVLVIKLKEIIEFILLVHYKKIEGHVKWYVQHSKVLAAKQKMFKSIQRTLVDD